MSAPDHITAIAEQWLSVPEYPDYAVSSLGQVKRIKDGKKRGYLTGQCLRQSVNRSGYYSVTLLKDGNPRQFRVNRLVCEVFHGPPPTPKHHAAHNDGTRHNNCADNLRWAAAHENEADKRAHGTAAVGDRHWSKLHPDRRAKGEGHGMSKLNADAVRAIRQDARYQRVIAKEYGVTQRVIWSIKTRVTWGHVQ